MILDRTLMIAVLLLVAGDAFAPPRLAALETEGTPSLRRMFVTSTTGTGDLSSWAGSGGVDGVAGANNVCQARAEAAGLATGGVPEFRAWLSIFNALPGDEIDAWCNVQGLTGTKTGGPACDGGTQIAAGPWVRTDGVLFGDSLAQLTTTGAYVPASNDEFGAEISGTTLHMTGTFLNGTRSSADCTGWTVTTGQLQPGSEQSTTGWGFISGLTLCSSTYRLACLEVGVGIPVKKPSAPGHLVFQSSASGSGDLSSWADAGGETGIAAADNVCVTAAGAAGLPSPSSFHAWLSDSTHDAACRIQGLTGLVSGSCDNGTAPLDAAYRRVDGFVLASSRAELLDAILDTTPSTNEFGDQLSASAWTGTLADGTLSGSGTCTDWALTSGAAQYGTATSLFQAWTQSGQALCSGSKRLYCVSTAVVIFWDNFESQDLSRWTLVSP